MIVVVLVLMLAYRAQVPSLQLRLKQPIPWGYAIIAMGYITFWAALRSGFVDTSAYIRIFNNSLIGWQYVVDAWEGTRQPGFDSLMIFFKTFISDDFHFWLTFISIASSIPLIITLRKYSCNYLYSIFIFITSTQFIWLFNGIRQFLVAAIMFGFGYLIKERKITKFIIIILLCSTIHKTALIMLPMCIFMTDKPFGRRILVYIAVVLLCAVSISPLLDSMDSLLQGTGYEKNLDQFAEDDGVHPLRVAFNSIPMILAFIRRKEILKKNNLYINICINMSTISAGLYFVGMLTSGIMIGRLPLYFQLYDLILIPYLIYFIYKEYSKILITCISVLYLIFYSLFASKFYYISDILGTFV